VERKACEGFREVDVGWMDEMAGVPSIPSQVDGRRIVLNSHFFLLPLD
jgi:hypothetical protein